MWKLYDRLIKPINDSMIDEIYIGNPWTMVRVGNQIGVASSGGISDSKFIHGKVETKLTLKEAAMLIKSWDFKEASIGMAAINCFYNQEDRLEELLFNQQTIQRLSSLDAFAVHRDQLENKKVATIGHFHYADEHVKNAKEIYILERNPSRGDYPDSACEYILPKMDYVFITGSSIVNKTLPRLLQLSKNAKVILVGPSVPITGCLFDFGANELAGTLIPDADLAEDFIKRGEHRAMREVGIPIRIGNSK